MLCDNMNTIELTCYTEIEPATNSPTTFAQYVYKLVPFPQLVDRQVGHARVDIKIKVHKDEITLIFFLQIIIIIKIIVLWVYGKYLVTKLCQKSIETSSNHRDMWVPRHML